MPYFVNCHFDFILDVLSSKFKIEISADSFKLNTTPLFKFNLKGDLSKDKVDVQIKGIEK